MRKWALVLALVFLASLAHAATFQPTVNPLIPVQNSPLSSLPIRNNFQYVYNDLVSVAALIGSGGGGGGGVGTVTSVSCSATLPITCSVATATTTPAISLTATVQGNGSKIQLGSGSTSTNDLLIYDANGNAVDSTATLASLQLTWPTTGSIVLSNGTNTPAGLAEIDGDCVKGTGGVWVAGSCGSGSGVTLSATTSNQNFYFGLTTTTNGSLSTLFGDNSVTINPSTNTITATTFAGTATNAVNVAMNNTTSNVGYDFLGATTTTGNLPIYANKGFTWNPSTGVLSIPSGGTYDINGTQIAASNLSNSTTGSGAVVLATSPTLTTPALGTPASGVATNLTGTAAGLTAGSVTTNANLTGPITSSGNATSIGAQTGTGSTFAMSASPTFTGTVGAAAITATSLVTGTFFLSPPSALTISTATFTPVSVGANTFRVVLIHASCPCTIANPSGSASDGERFLIEIWQSSTGSDTIGTWGTNYDFGAVGAPTLSTGANKGDLLGFSYSAQNSKYNYIGVQQGM